MPQIDLNRGVPIPAPLLQPELARLLIAIEAAQPPFEEFPISVDLGDLHLPNAGVISVPIELHCYGHNVASNAPIGFGFQAKQRGALFPKFTGALSVEPAGSPHSCVRLRGEYEPPMGAVGKILDATVLRSVAERSLRAFLAQLTSEAETSVRRREAEVVQARRFA